VTITINILNVGESYFSARAAKACSRPPLTLNTSLMPLLVPKLKVQFQQLISGGRMYLLWQTVQEVL
jgi:hypothetical protein